MALGGIESPYTLASLPRPLDPEFGQVWAAPVLGLSKSRKRKRHEVAVGVDGECVNIYNVQTSDLITSYAVPPQSYLAAKPCSVHCKRAKPFQPQRRTYITLKDTPQGANLRLICIVEELGGIHSVGEDVKAPEKTERKLKHGELASVDVVFTARPDDSNNISPLLLVSYENGNVECISGDLSTIRWSHSSSDPANACVEFSKIVDWASARKGFLRDRQDILATTDPTGNGSFPLLCQIVRSGSQRWLRTFAIRNIALESLHTSRPVLEEILAYELPSRTKQNPGPGEYQLHASNGTLLQCSDQRLVVYDISGTVAKVKIELSRKAAARIKSFARLSSSSVIVTTNSGIAVYETKYGSLIASTTIPESERPIQINSQIGLPNDSSLQIVSHYTEIGLLVAIRGSDLLATQLSTSLQADKRMKRQGPSLIDVIGKGKHLIDGNASIEKAKKKRRFQDWKVKVDSFVDQSDVHGLEALIASDLHLNQNEPSPGTHINSDDRTYEAGTWILPDHAYDPKVVSNKQANYILKKCFTWEAPSSTTFHEQHRLVLQLKSRNILRWLARAGYLSPLHMEHVLGQPANDQTLRSQIIPGDVMNAVRRIDKEFAIICDLLTLPIHWDLPEVVQSLKLLLQSLDDRQHGEPESTATKETADKVMSDIDAQIAAEVLAADEELAHASLVIESGLQVRNETLRVIINRLEAFAPREVTACMHAMLSQKEIYFFLCVLRSELAGGGWTSQYVDGLDDEQDVQPDFDGYEKLDLSQGFTSNDRAIRTISHLLGCAMDAIGMSGWLISGNKELDGAQELVQHLAYEVSAALSGCIEANRLDMMFREISRTAGSGGHLKRKLGDNETDLLSAMPLGGRAHASTAATWAARDVKKTRALSAEQRHREVGKYVFETIRI